MRPRPATQATEIDLADQATFARVHREHVTSVRQAALRVLRDHGRAEEVTQDVFLRLWTNPRRFDRRRGELGSYLRLMARSRAIDLWRQVNASAAPAVLHLDPDDQPGRAAEREPAATVERQAQSRALRQAVRELPADQREALVLFYWGGMTAAEIARCVGVPLGTAKSRIRLAVARLRRSPEALGA